MIVPCAAAIKKKILLGYKGVRSNPLEPLLAMGLAATRVSFGLTLLEPVSKI